MDTEDPSRISGLVSTLVHPPHYSMSSQSAGRRGQPKKVRPGDILRGRQEGEGVSKARCPPFLSP